MPFTSSYPRTRGLSYPHFTFKMRYFRRGSISVVFYESTSGGSGRIFTIFTKSWEDYFDKSLWGDRYDSRVFLLGRVRDWRFLLSCPKLGDFSFGLCLGFPVLFPVDHLVPLATPCRTLFVGCLVLLFLIVCARFIRRFFVSILHPLLLPSCHIFFPASPVVSSGPCLGFTLSLSSLPHARSQSGHPSVLVPSFLLPSVVFSFL